MVLDRVTPPIFADIEPFKLIKPEMQHVASGLNAFILEHGNQDVCRIEFAFSAGKWFEPYTGVSYFTAKLLAEGTLNKLKSYKINNFLVSTFYFLLFTFYFLLCNNA